MYVAGIPEDTEWSSLAHSACLIDLSYLYATRTGLMVRNILVSTYLLRVCIYPAPESHGRMGRYQLIAVLIFPSVTANT